MTNVNKTLSRLLAGCLAAAVFLACEDIPRWAYEINNLSGVTAAADSETGITVSWDGISGVAGYNVYRSTNANGPYSQIGNVTSTSYTDYGLSANTTYYYKVAAYNRAGNAGAQSYSVSAKTLTAPKNQYTVTFDAGGGTVSPAYGTTGADGKLAYLPTPARSGYTFDGWYTANIGGAPVTTNTVFGENVTVYAKWVAGTVTTYIIIFDATGGLVSPAAGTTGASGTLSSLPTPTKEGYTFNGWYTAKTGGTPVTTNTVFGESVTVFAQWAAGSVATYTIIFDPNGGAVTPASGTTTASGTLAYLPTPTREGYTFDRWFTAATGGTAVTINNTVFNDTATIFARWTDTYTVMFDANGGEGTAPGAQTVNESLPATLPNSGGLTRNGYTFDGWNTDSSGAGTTYEIGSSYTPTANSTLYAKWKTITCEITYNLNDGTVSTDNPESYTVETEDFTLNNPTKTGYTFTGWTGTNGEAPQTAVTIAQGSTGDKEYTANWTLDTYTIAYTLNNGTVSSANPTTYTVTTEDFTLNNPTKNGYTFAGWTGANGTTAQTSVTIAKGSTGDKEYTANWTTATAYTITYDLDGGTEPSPANQTSYTVETANFTLNNPIKTGYTFAGWTGANGTTAQTSVTIAKGSTGDKEYTANWTLDTYKITFNPNGGTVTPDSGTTGTGWKLASLPTPTRTGYTFNGWFTAAANGKAVTKDTAFTKADTIYAQWTLDTYKITFNPNGGTVTPDSGTTGTDWKLASLPTPTRTGYTFDGWFTALTGGTAVTENDVYSASMTIYAQWTKQPPTVETFTDSRGSGTTYKKVTIGSQTWMAENLNYNASGSVCYGNADSNCTKYGRLYNWSTAMNGASSSSASSSGVQGVCPAGWHLPSDAEWTTLTNYVGTNAGTKLKSSQYWNSYSGVPAGTDDFGFAALPGGNGYSDGTFGNAGNIGDWWSATEIDADYAWSRSMSYGSEGVYRNWDYKTHLFSVRCVQD